MGTKLKRRAVCIRSQGDGVRGEGPAMREEKQAPSREACEWMESVSVWVKRNRGTPVEPL